MGSDHVGGTRELCNSLEFYLCSNGLKKVEKGSEEEGNVAV